MLTCLYPLNKSEMFYCNVEAKITYWNRTLAIIIHHNDAHELLLKQTKCFSRAN